MRKEFVGINMSEGREESRTGIKEKLDYDAVTKRISPNCKL